MHNWFLRYPPQSGRSPLSMEKDLHQTGLNRIIRLWFMIYAAKHKSTISSPTSSSGRGFRDDPKI